VYFGTEGTVQAVSLSDPSRNQDVLTFAFAISTDHGLASGVGDFSVSFADSVVHTRQVQAEGGGGRIDVRFADFVMGNGNYTFAFTYHGHTATSSYSIGVADKTEFIVTGIFVSSQLVYPSGTRVGAILVRVDFLSDAAKNRYAAAPPGANITYRVLKNGITQDAPPTERGVEGRTFLSFNYTPNLLLGNYTVEVTYHNTWVKPDSTIANLVATNVTFVHNRPTACTDMDTYHGTSNNRTITFDAGCSSDDGAVIQYTWDFGDGSPAVTSLSSPIEAHTFPSNAPRDYVGNLTVKDNGPDGGQDDWKNFAIHITIF